MAWSGSAGLTHIRRRLDAFAKAVLDAGKLIDAVWPSGDLRGAAVVEPDVGWTPNEPYGARVTGGLAPDHKQNGAWLHRLTVQSDRIASDSPAEVHLYRTGKHVQTRL